MANNNYPQITSVTSEALQAQIRSLLPSQEGFGTDLMAQNVIVPIIDLTSAAEGSSTPAYLSNSLAFGSQTAISVTNTSTTIANTAGFYRVIGTVSSWAVAGTVSSGSFTMSDGFSTKTIWEMSIHNQGVDNIISESFDFNVFVASGITLNAVSNSVQARITGSIRQIADSNGTIVNPSGFNPQ